jgi:carbonic anhydrase
MGNNNTKPDLERLFEQNRQWIESVTKADPDYFSRLVDQQNPEYLWIGCSDSRVPANQIVGLKPGEVFVHRNIANIVVHTDFNALSVIQFAIDRLKVKHIIVVGHYGCSGIAAAMNNIRIGLADNWIRHIKDVHDKHHHELCAIEEENARLDRLCELNVLEQVINIGETNIVQDAWAKGQTISIHGCIYRLHDGLLKDLHTSISNPQELHDRYHAQLMNSGPL